VLEAVHFAVATDRLATTKVSLAHSKK